MKDADDLKTKGNVWVRCRKCSFDYLISFLDSLLPNGPFECYPCRGYTLVKHGDHAQWKMLH